MPRVQLLGCTVIACLNLLETAKLFKEAELLYILTRSVIPTSSIWVNQFLCIPATTQSYHCSLFQPLEQVCDDTVVFICITLIVAFICISPMINDAFHVLICHLYILKSEISVYIFWSFSNCILGAFLLLILDARSLLDMGLQISSPTPQLVFSSSSWIPSQSTGLNFGEVQFIDVSSFRLCF